ncbi:MAG: hypothetical protein KF696_01250 [Planctomycetes bacterium]|nr:hypothetical protein [Planctomycetota bacterium]MCW8134434.1 hypothetical protein [Planctomycetota bacterium]
MARRRANKPKRRKLEVHVLIISGMDGPAGYIDLLTNTRSRMRTLRETLIRVGSKNHGMEQVEQRGDAVALRFFSFTEGERPDVLDTDRFEIQDSPLSESQTPLAWTHVVGKPVGDKFVLVIEKSQGGLWPNALEDYLNDLLFKFHKDERDRPTYTVSVEPKAGSRFVARVRQMDRIRRASIRTARPNPGWADLETTLGHEAGASNAHKAEVEMTAARNAGLSRNNGIVKRILDLAAAAQLTFAAIEGERNGQHERFDSEKLGEYRYVDLNVDTDGKVVKESAFNALAALLDEQA